LGRHHFYIRRPVFIAECCHRGQGGWQEGEAVYNTRWGFNIF